MSYRGGGRQKRLLENSLRRANFGGLDIKSASVTGGYRNPNMDEIVTELRQSLICRLSRKWKR